MSGIDLSFYAPGAHPSGGGDFHCCCRHDGTPGSRYEHEDELFVKDGQHVVFLLWSEGPNAGVHTGWGGTDVWACRCGWQDDEGDGTSNWPGMPPFGEPSSPERSTHIAWQKENWWWLPSPFEMAKMHALQHKAHLVRPGDWTENYR